MKDMAISTFKLKEKETSLKTSQAEHAHKLMTYMSDKIGKKLNSSEVYFLSLQMFNSDPFVNNLMSNLEKITIEQQHVSELVEEVNRQIGSPNPVQYYH